jgi:hypothetical protein
VNYCTTRQTIHGKLVVVVHWYKDKDGLGWKGRFSFFVPRTEGNSFVTMCQNHSVSLRQTLPLGMISVMLDGCAGGCWKDATFEGTTITERDLQWATSWGVLAIQDKHLRCHELTNFSKCSTRLDAEVQALEDNRHNQSRIS